MKTTKRILALLLSLSLVIGMMPGISLTAYAEETVAEEVLPAETVVETIAEETEPVETVAEETVPETTIPEETVPAETEAEEAAPVEVVVFNPVTKEVMGTQLASDVNYIDPSDGYDYDNPYYPVWEWNADGTEISAFMQTEADYIIFAVTVSGSMYFGDQFITNLNGTEEEPFIMTCYGPEDGSLWGLMVTVKIDQFSEEPEPIQPVAEWEYIEDEEWDTVDWETSWEEPFNPTWTYNEDGTGMVACVTVTGDFNHINYYVPEAGALYEGGWPNGDGYTEAWFFGNVPAGHTSRISWQGDYGMSFRLTVMFADGESGSDQPSEPDGTVYNEQYLQDQIDAGNWEIFADKEIVLENDFVIPNNVGFTVENTLTVPDGVTLTVNSGRFHIYDGGLLQVEEGGHLVIGNTISCWNGAAMNIEGTYEFSTDWGYIIVNYEDGVSADQFSGIADEDISLRFIPASEEELQEAAEIMNSADFGSYIVLVHDSLTLTEDFTIPGNCTFTISDRGSTVTIDDGVTLTNYGQLYVNPDETLHNYGTIVNNGQFSNDGTVINDGEVQNRSHLNNWGTWEGNEATTPPMSQDDLEEALDALDPYYSYWLNNTVILERDLTIDEDQYLGIGPGGKLVVPEGITLTAGTNINVNAGGVLEIEGEFVKAHQEPWLASVGYENGELGNIIGIDRSEIAVDYYVNMNNPDALQDAEALLEDWGFGWNYIYLWVDVRLEEDFTVSENTFLHIYDGNTLTIPEGVTLTIQGEQYLWENGRIVNNGTIENDGFQLVVGTLTNNGTVNVNGHLVVDGPGTVQNNGDVYINGGYELYGTWLGNDPVQAEMTQDKLEEALDALEPNNGYYLTQPVTLERDMMLTKNFLIGPGGKLIIPEGVTLTTEVLVAVNPGGILEVYGEIVSDNQFLVSNVYENGEEGHIIGLDRSKILLDYYAYDADDLLEAEVWLSECGYGKKFLDVFADITLDQDCTIPENTEMVIYDCTVTVAEGVTLTNKGALCMRGENPGLVNNGTIENDGHIAVAGMLTNNGTINVNDQLYVDYSGTVENNGDVYINGEYVMYGTWNGNDPILSTGMATEQYIQDKINSGETEIFVDCNITLENNYRLPSGVEVYIEEGCTLTIPRGVRFTVESPITVFGIIDNQNRMQVNAPIYFREDGSYAGNGIIRVDMTRFFDLGDALDGLDLNGFELIGGPGYVDVHDTTGLPRLGTPTDLHWENGYACWTMTEPHERNARIYLYQVGVEWPIADFGCGWMEGDSYSFNMLNMLDLSVEGSYYFTVEASSSQVDYGSSEPAVSEVWDYIPPETDMGLCTDVVFDGLTVTWTCPEGTDANTLYEIEFYYLYFVDDVPYVSHLNRGEGTFNGSFDLGREWGYFYDDFGPGNYFVQVRALSENVMEVGHGPWYGSNEVSYNGYSFELLMSYAVLKKQVAEHAAMGGMSVQLRERVVLEGDLEFPENVPLNIYEGGELIVPAGCTLTINSSSYMMQGKLIVEEGGKLVINRDFWTNYGDTVEVLGEVEFGWNAYLNTVYDSNCTITGVPVENQKLNFYCETTEALKDAVAFMEANDYGRYVINAWPPAGGELILDFDMTIPVNCTFQVGYVTITEGTTVINNGIMQVGDGQRMTNNGTVINKGTVDIYPEYGHWEGNAPVAGTIADTGRTLSLDGMIYINQYVKPEGFEGVDIEANGGLLIWNSPVSDEEAVFGTEDTHVAGLMDAGKGEYAQQGPGIVAKSYADDIYLRVYIKDNDGNYVYSPLTVYSVRTYCESRLEKSSNMKLKNTCANLLHFGAAAQTYFNYNVDDPANKNIVDTWPQPEWDAGLIDALEEPVTNIVGTGTVTDNGKTLSLTGALFVNFYFGPDASVGEPTTAELLFWDEVNGELTLDNVSYKRDLIATGKEYAAQSDMFAAREFGKTLFVCAHFVDEDGNDHYSDVTAYSPEEYAAGRLQKSSNANLKALVKAMVTYGEMARIYFAK